MGRAWCRDKTLSSVPKKKWLETVHSSQKAQMSQGKLKLWTSFTVWWTKSKTQYGIMWDCRTSTPSSSSSLKSKPRSLKPTRAGRPMRIWAWTKWGVNLVVFVLKMQSSSRKSSKRGRCWYRQSKTRNKNLTSKSKTWSKISATRIRSWSNFKWKLTK